MNVKQLIEKLSTLPQDMKIYVEYRGEHRELNDDDVDVGTYYDVDGNCELEDEEEEQVAVLITSWS
jgi:hypothetical protein